MLGRLQVFSKCGILKEDDDRKPKVKVYRDKDTQLAKGDGLVTYLKDPSVSLQQPMPVHLSLSIACFPGTCGEARVWEPAGAGVSFLDGYTQA